jgi:hypothetical protein
MQRNPVHNPNHGNHGDTIPGMSDPFEYGVPGSRRARGSVPLRELRNSREAVRSASIAVHSRPLSSITVHRPAVSATAP